MEISLLGDAFMEWVGLWIGDPSINFLSFALLALFAIGMLSWVWKYLICRKGG